MRTHRFYVDPELKLTSDFWLHDERLVNQWNRVLRFKPGQELVLFDGEIHERLYRLIELSNREAHLQLVTDFVRKLPKIEVYLFWSLLKSDKNDLVLQKGTELGVSHFIPLLAERSEKTGFNYERAKKIVIEAAEQCGRSDIPALRESMAVVTAIVDYTKDIQLFVCEQYSAKEEQVLSMGVKTGVLVGPEGGWSGKEKQLFQDNKLGHLNLGDFTLRAETASIVAASKLLQ